MMTEMVVDIHPFMLSIGVNVHESQCPPLTKPPECTSCRYLNVSTHGQIRLTRRLPSSRLRGKSASKWYRGRQKLRAPPFLTPCARPTTQQNRHTPISGSSSRCVCILKAQRKPQKLPITTHPCFIKACCRIFTRRLFDSSLLHEEGHRSAGSSPPP